MPPSWISTKQVFKQAFHYQAHISSGEKTVFLIACLSVSLFILLILVYHQIIPILNQFMQKTLDTQSLGSLEVISNSQPVYAWTRASIGQAGSKWPNK